jgi:hypothetical protein
MTQTIREGAVNRRDFLAGSGKTAIGAAMVLGSGTLLMPNQGWGMELKAIKPETMATMIQMARDIYPHDRVADKFYAKAMRAHDDAAVDDDALHAMIEESRLDLDARAGKKLLDKYGTAEGGYLDMGWEADRVSVLHEIEDTEFFAAMRGSLVVGLYNQKAIWPLFGYQGASSHMGGYIDRGFDDIEWV